MKLAEILRERFADNIPIPTELDNATKLIDMAARGSCRTFDPQPIPSDVIRTLAAVALSSPTKSDLQQRDIIHVSDPSIRLELNEAMRGQSWIVDAPSLLVFCGNNKRQRLLHEMRGLPFANDHLDAFFNASVDAAVALSAFVLAAETIGLGCCPISAIRNNPERVSDALNLPDHVFPVAGLAVGYPSAKPEISMRIHLDTTFHQDTYSDADVVENIKDYDSRRETAQPYKFQRSVDLYGEDAEYTWSKDKARQYSQPERSGFGAFIRKKGFKLD